MPAELQRLKQWLHILLYCEGVDLLMLLLLQLLLLLPVAAPACLQILLLLLLLVLGALLLEVSCWLCILLGRHAAGNVQTTRVSVSNV
jgi:hypothetical protein